MDATLNAGQIVADLVANDDGFFSTFNKAIQASSKLEKSIIGAGAASTVFAGTLAILTKQTANYEDHLNDLSQTLGVSTEQISRHAVAAKLSGLELEDYAKSVQKLEKNAVAAAEGNKQATATFDQLGISVKDATGHVKTGDALLEEVADKFSKVHDGATKTAAAMDLMGKSGAKMIPMLNEGADGLAEMSKESERMGMVVSAKAAKAADEFNDNIDKLELSLTGLRNKVAESVIQWVNHSGVMDKLSKAVQTVTEWWNKLDDGTKETIVTATALAVGITTVTGAVVALTVALPALETALAAAGMATGITEVAIAITAATAAIANIYDIIEKGEAGPLRLAIAGFTLLASPIVQVGVAAVLLYKNWGKVMAAFHATEDILVPIGKTIYNILSWTNPLVATFNALKAAVSWVKDLAGLKEFKFDIPDLSRLFIDKVVNPVSEKITVAGAVIPAVFGKAWDVAIENTAIKMKQMGSVIKGANEILFGKNELGLTWGNLISTTTPAVHDFAQEVGGIWIQTETNATRVAKEESEKRLKIYDDNLKARKEAAEKDKVDGLKGDLAPKPEKKKILFDIDDFLPKESDLAERSASLALTFSDTFNGTLASVRQKAIEAALSEDKTNEEAQKAGNDAAEKFSDSWSKVMGKALDMVAQKFLQTMQTISENSFKVAENHLKGMENMFNFFSDAEEIAIKARNDAEVEAAQEAEDAKLAVLRNALDVKLALIDSEFAARKAALDAELARTLQGIQDEKNARLAAEQQRSVDTQELVTAQAQTEQDALDQSEFARRQYEERLDEIRASSNAKSKAEKESNDRAMQDAEAESQARMKAIKDKQVAEEKERAKKRGLIEYGFALSNYKTQQHAAESAAAWQFAIGESSAIVAAFNLMASGGPTPAAAITVPAGIALGATLTALNIAAYNSAKGLIASTPMPLPPADVVAARGGLLTGPSHAGGGVNVNAEGGEYIMPREVTSSNIHMLEAMRSGRIGSGMGGVMLQIGQIVLDPNGKNVQEVASDLGFEIRKEVYG